MIRDGIFAKKEGGDMGFCWHISLRHILGNRKKSMPLFFCIFLAVFILVNLFGVYESFQEMLLEDTKESYGAYHFYLKDAEEGWKEKLAQRPEIERVGAETSVDTAELLGFDSETIDKEQLLQVTSMDTDAMDLNVLRLKSGRLPERDGEILLSAGIEVTDGYAYQKVGADSTVRIRRSSGEEETFQVVGILDNFNAGQVDNVYRALVRGSETGTRTQLYATIKTAGDMKQTMRRIADDLGIGEQEIYEFGNRIVDKEDTLEQYRLIENGQLIGLLHEGSPDDSQRAVVYITQIMIVFILLIAALIIWNMYALLFEQRREEYGLLRICGMSPKKIWLSVGMESAVLYMSACLCGVFLANSGKAAMQQLIQMLRFSSMEHLRLMISWRMAGAGALAVFLIVFLIVVAQACLMMKCSSVEMLHGTAERARLIRKRRTQSGRWGNAKKGYTLHQPTATFLVGKRNLFRKKGKTVSMVLSLSAAVLFFVTFCSMIEVLDQKVVKDVTMIPTSQYMIARDFEAFPPEFIDQIPNTEFKYTTSISGTYFHIPPDIKDARLKQYYAQETSGQTVDEIFNEERVYVEVDGISREQFDQFEWFDQQELTWDEWVASGKALIDDTVVQTAEDGTKTYLHQLSIDPRNYVLRYEGETTDWGEGHILEFDGGEMTFAARVGSKLYAREDNFIFINVFLPEEVVREQFAPLSQFMYMNAVKGKETELGVWLREHSLEHGYTIWDDVKKYAAAYDTQTTLRAILWSVFVAVVLVSALHIFNTVRSSIMTRKKELAILMALGMSRWQVRKSVLWEHAAYGVFGGVAGSLLSLALLERLLKLLSGADSVNMVIPWDYLVSGFSGVVMLSLAVAFAATGVFAKTSIVEEMREHD